MPQSIVTRWDDLPGQVTNSVLRTAFTGTGAELKRVVVPAGVVAPRHEHEHEQFLLVLQGKATLTTPDGTFALEPGTVVHFKPQTWHEAQFETDTVLVEVNLT